MYQAQHETELANPQAVPRLATNPTRSVIGSASPLIPLLLVFAIGIFLDRWLDLRGEAPETVTWGGFGLVGSLAALWLIRASRLGAIPLLATFLCLGAGWNHHRRADRAPDDLARSISDSPYPVWIKGTIRELLDVRRPQTPEAGEGRTIAGDPTSRASTRFLVDVSAVRDGSAWRVATGRAIATVVGNDRSDLRAGQAIEAAGSLASVGGPLNPGEFDLRERLRGEGVRLRLTIKDPASLRPGDPQGDRILLRWRGALRFWSQEQLVKPLSPETAPVASALVLGRRQEIGDDLNDAFVRTGTTHLLAISGLHLQVLALGLAMAFHLAGLSRGATALAVAMAVTAYAILVGLSPSVVRSAAMTVTICLATLLYRQSRTANNLALAGLVTLAIDPSNLFDVGCQLSFLAIIALVWMIPEARLFLEANYRSIRDRLEGPPSPLDALERKYEPKWKRRIRRSFGWGYHALLTSFVVWIAALPLVMLRFHLISPVGIALNLLLIPLTSWALLTGGLGLGLSAVWAPLGVPFGWATSTLLDATIRLVHWGTGLSWGHVFVAGLPAWWVCGFYGIMGAAVVSAVIVRERGDERSRRWFARRRLLWFAWTLWIVPGAPLAVVSDRPARLEADLLAVGHGLAAVVQTPSGAAYLYDCGRMGDPEIGRRVIAPALWSRGISRLNSVILSHADDDHYNGLPDLFDRFRIGEVCIPPGFGGPGNPGALALIEAIQTRGIPIRTLAAPDSWTVGSATFRIWHPPAGWAPDASDNARSIVLEVESAGKRLLLTGDLEQVGLNELVARPLEGSAIDVMLSPHHGGKSANPPWLYKWGEPRAVLVSQRAPVAGGTDLLSKLEQNGTAVYRTWRDGAARLVWEPQGIAIRSFLDETSPPAAVLPTLEPTGGIMLVSIRVVRWAVAFFGFHFGLLAIFWTAVIEFGAWTLLVPPRPSERSRSSQDPQVEPIVGTPLTLTAADGSRLAGQLFPVPAETGSRGTVLLLHGFGESVGILAALRCPALNREGWDVLVPESRGYGASAGPYATFGAREAGDIGTWIDVIRGMRRFPEDMLARPVIVWGRSMGGAIAALAAASGLPIAALILESPMLDLRAALAAIFWRKHFPFASTLAGRVIRRASRLAGVPIGRPRLAEIVPKVACPVLILQGTEDSLASIETIRHLGGLFTGPAEVVEVSGAGHTDVIEVGGDAVWRRILDFLKIAGC